MDNFSHSTKPKSRKLGIYAFFEILQIEWIVADLRFRLYPNMKDKDYWKRVMDGKKKTIEQIAYKNQIPTIFTDKDIWSIIEGKVFKPTSFPNFHYRDEEVRKRQEPLDLLYYYAKDADIRFEGEGGEIKIGKVLCYVPYEPDITVRLIDGIECRIPVDKVTRIL